MSIHNMLSSRIQKNIHLDIPIIQSYIEWIETIVK